MELKAEFAMPRSSKRYALSYDKDTDFETVITQFKIDHAELNYNNLILKSLNGYEYKNKKVPYQYFVRLLNYITTASLPDIDLIDKLDRILFFSGNPTDRFLKNIGQITNAYDLEGYTIAVFKELTTADKTTKQTENKLSYQELLERYNSLVNSKNHIQHLLTTHVDTIQMQEISEVNNDLLASLKQYVPDFDNLNTGERFLLAKEVMDLAYQKDSWVQSVSERNMDKMLELVHIITG